MYIFKIRNDYKILNDFILRIEYYFILYILYYKIYELEYKIKNAICKKKRKKSFFFLNIEKIII